MTEWAKVNIPEDPDWEEYYTEVEHKDLGPCRIHVWGSSDGYRFSTTDCTGRRSISAYLPIHNIEDAKSIALDRFDPPQDKDNADL